MLFFEVKRILNITDSYIHNHLILINIKILLYNSHKLFEYLFY
jgi:hypothetical protein